VDSNTLLAVVAFGILLSIAYGIYDRRSQSTAMIPATEYQRQTGKLEQCEDMMHELSAMMGEMRVNMAESKERAEKAVAAAEKERLGAMIMEGKLQDLQARLLRMDVELMAERSARDRARGDTNITNITGEAGQAASGRGNDQKQV
jgi:hypothetical protein